MGLYFKCGSCSAEYSWHPGRCSCGSTAVIRDLTREEQEDRAKQAESDRRDALARRQREAEAAKSHERAQKAASAAARKSTADKPPGKDARLSDKGQPLNPPRSLVVACALALGGAGLWFAYQAGWQGWGMLASAILPMFVARPAAVALIRILQLLLGLIALAGLLYVAWLLLR